MIKTDLRYLPIPNFILYLVEFGRIMSHCPCVLPFLLNLLYFENDIFEFFCFLNFRFLSKLNILEHS